MSLLLRFDGACVRNPGGPGGWGYTIHKDSLIVQTECGGIGEGQGVTNNIAEWEGMLHGLTFVANNLMPVGRLLICGDSKLVIKQAQGSWRAKKDHLQQYVALYNKLANHIGRSKITLRWIPREENEKCDALSKRGCYQPSRLVNLPTVPKQTVGQQTVDFEQPTSEQVNLLADIARRPMVVDDYLASLNATHEDVVSGLQLLRAVQKIKT